MVTTRSTQNLGRTSMRDLMYLSPTTLKPASLTPTPRFAPEKRTRAAATTNPPPATTSKRPARGVKKAARGRGRARGGRGIQAPAPPATVPALAAASGTCRQAPYINQERNH